MPCQAGTTRTLWRALLLFDRARFVDKLGSHAGSIDSSTETAVKLKKNDTWCEILRKRPCKRTRKNLRKWSEIFSRVSNRYFCGRRGISFRRFFSQKISHWPSNFFGYPQPLGVCAIVPRDCNHRNGTAEPARWRRKPLHCQRRRVQFSASPSPLHSLLAH